nr:hypothetical protein [uncultured Marinifilum sp.]
MKQKQIKINKLIFLLIISIILIPFSSCSAQKKKEVDNSIRVQLLTDTIQEPYAYFSEIKVNPINKSLLKNIQNLSENKSLNSIRPEERLQEKMELCNLCQEANISDCNYTPEGYKILTQKNSILNIEYGYNMFSNPDEYFKYAVFNLENGERITYKQMFNNAEAILKMYNDKYVSEIQDYLTELNKDDEEEFGEYDRYKSHLETRTPFQLEDLNNFEIVYDSTETKVKQLKFHYNGQGGVYRRFFPPGFEEFSIEELKPHLKEDFKKRIGLE